jgi:hypothetical protein
VGIAIPLRRQARELSILRYSEITLAKARELAMGARAKIQQGADVARNKRRASIERAAAKSFGQLATGYMDRAGGPAVAFTVPSA